MREAAAHLDAGRVLDERHRRQMAGDDFAEGDVDEVAILIDHRVERVEFADLAHDLELLLVQRIADEVALHGERIFHEARGMEGADCRVAGDAGRHHFAAAGPAGHEVRLDEAGGDAQIGLDEDPVDADRRAARRGRSQIDMIVRVARVMVQHANVRHHPRIADDLGQFVAQIGPVQAGGDQDGDAVEGNAARDHGFDHRAQEQPVRHRPRDVADQNAGAASAARQVGQRSGIDRMIESMTDRRRVVGEFGQRGLADDRWVGVRRQRDGKHAATISQLDVHVCHEFLDVWCCRVARRRPTARRADAALLGRRPGDDKFREGGSTFVRAVRPSRGELRSTARRPRGVDTGPFILRYF